MSIVKISQLNPASSVGTEDSLILLQSGLTLKTTADLLFDAVTSDRDLADKTYVNLAISSAVNSLINGAPTILDTLKELATAIGNDPNFAASIIAQINQKVSADDFNTLFSTQFATKTTTNLSEGTNKFYTDSRARSAITVEGAGSYNSTTGVITVVGGVTSVNSKSGSVTLTTTDIAEGSNKYYTDAKVRDAISTFGSFLSYNNSTGVISYDLEPTFDAVYLNSEITANKQAVTKEYVDNAINSYDPTNIDGGDVTNSVDDFSGTMLDNYGYSLENLSAVAFSGRYGDLISKPELFSGSYTDLTNRPELFSGSYTDLTNRPDWSTTTNITEGTNKYYTNQRVAEFLETRTSDILTEGTNNLYFTNERVISALSGLTTDDVSESTAIGGRKYYSDALVDNRLAVLEVATKNWVNIQLADISDSVEIITTIATDFNSKLSIDDFNTSTITGEDVVFTGSSVNGVETSNIGFATVATSGSYNDLLDKPTLFNGSYNSLADQPDLNIASVARSGSYADLTSKPSTADIPEGGTTNLYFTQTRARHSISATGGISYNEDTGIITTPTRLVDKPSSPNGSSINKRGDYSIDGVDLYICNADYTDGNAFIWVKISGTTSWS